MIAIEHPALAETLAGSNTTNRFLEYRERRGLNLTIDHTNPGPEQEPKHIGLRANATEVLVAPAANTTYLIVNLTRAPLTGGYPSQRTQLRGGERFEITFEIGPDVVASGQAARATTTFTVKRREAVVRTDSEVVNRLYVLPAANQTIRGSTDDIRPNRTLVVRLVGHDTPGTAVDESFTKVQHTAVGRDGRYTATFNFSDIPSNTTFTIDVRFDSHSLLENPPTGVVAPITATVSIRDVNTSGRYVAVTARTRLSRGGFVVLHRGSPDGPVVGVSSYLRRGRHQNVTIYVGRPPQGNGTLIVAAHRDTNDNRWFDTRSIDSLYTDGREAVAVGSEVTLTPAATSTPYPTPTTRSPSEKTVGTTTQPTEQTPTEPTRSTTTTESGTKTHDEGARVSTDTVKTPMTTAPATGVSVPGFGIVSTVVAGLSVMVLAALRWR